MNENTAKSLVTSLINAAYEAGMWKKDPNQAVEPHWKEKAEKIGDEIIYRLSNQSSGQKEIDALSKFDSKFKDGMPKPFLF